MDTRNFSDPVIMLHMIVGPQRASNTGGTPGDWLTLADKLEPVFHGRSAKELTRELGVSQSLLGSLKLIVKNKGSFALLLDVIPFSRFGYNWACRFATAEPAAQEEAIALMRESKAVLSEEVLKAVVRKHRAPTRTHRRQTTSKRLSVMGIEPDCANHAANSALIAAQSVKDIIDEVNESISGRVDGSGKLSKEDAATYFEEQLKSVATRITVASGGRSSVRVSVKDKRMQVSFRALRKDHPIKATFVLEWAE